MSRENEPGSRVVNGTVIGPNGELRGRAKGAANKGAALLKDAQRQIEEKFGIVGAHPVTKLMVMGFDETLEPALRAQCLGKAAPYVATQLKAVEVTGEGGGPVQVDTSDVRAKVAKLLNRTSQPPTSDGDAIAAEEEEAEEPMTPEREARIAAAQEEQAERVRQAEEARQLAKDAAKRKGGRPAEDLSDVDETLTLVPGV